MSSQIIFDFTTDTDIQHWRVVDDGVMGGVSSGKFTVSEDGFGVFAGKVSLENNGGFSSVRYRLNKLPVKSATTVRIKLRGDGKKYQFRVKASAEDRYSYIATFSTSGEWEEIVIPLADMYPAFRGRKLDQPNFQQDYLEEIAFLIGNKKEETFKLMIDKIVLE
ncbi:CIA30 family protein [Tunicatimonas pelagia]|uniref:CIA30 family protein n=1 Tax=Tunicatimonas pelagia TaxID=931531 RepID=UPI0026655944|nr:CIA30 family protein [Tunicatimonas pelagia]WKN44356.1 CIA30 family protein [Tunicatimonas pelagia]